MCIHIEWWQRLLDKLEKTPPGTGDTCLAVKLAMVDLEVCQACLQTQSEYLGFKLGIFAVRTWRFKRVLHLLAGLGQNPSRL